jgi:hypothetical protein
MAVTFLAFIGLPWLFTSVAFHIQVVFSVLATCIGIALLTLFTGLHHYQRRLGPYLVANGDGIHLRHGRRITFEDFASFDVTRSWEPAGDNETKVSHLVLNSKAGERVEIIASVHHRSVATLKRSLDRQMQVLFGAATAVDG